jgi:hypothetical protein
VGGSCKQSIEHEEDKEATKVTAELLFHSNSLTLGKAVEFMSDYSQESVLVCPVCGFAKAEEMPTGACQFFYECTNCKTLLRPKPGDCCVFCSYGSVPCPPKQREGSAGDC